MITVHRPFIPRRQGRHQRRARRDCPERAQQLSPGQRPGNAQRTHRVTIERFRPLARARPTKPPPPSPDHDACRSSSAALANRPLSTLVDRQHSHQRLARSRLRDEHAPTGFVEHLDRSRNHVGLRLKRLAGRLGEVRQRILPRRVQGLPTKAPVALSNIAWPKECRRGGQPLILVVAKSKKSLGVITLYLQTQSWHDGTKTVRRRYSRLRPEHR